MIRMRWHRPSSSLLRAATGLALSWLLAGGALAAAPARVIFDTDMGSDVDDVGAVAVLHALADRGEAEIVAMGLSVKHPWSAPCLDALNTHYGRPDIPIGVLKGPGVDDGCKYAQGVAEAGPHDLKSADDAPDVVAVYRKALAGQPDGAVVFVTVGFLTNAAKLLESGPDEHSPLAGVELVRRKVRRWVCMGGTFPEGREYNLFRDAPASRKALAAWPTPITFSGFEIGEPIQTGAGLKASPRENPVRRAYELYNGLVNRSSWDQTAVLHAVRGIDGGAGSLWDVSAPGTNEVLPDGNNRWHAAPDGRHSYLVRKQPPAREAEVIEGLMAAPPRHAAP